MLIFEFLFLEVRKLNNKIPNKKIRLTVAIFSALIFLSLVGLVFQFSGMGSFPSRGRIKDDSFSGKTRPAGRVVIGIKSDAVSLNPVLADDEASNIVNSLMFNGLVKFGDTDEIVPDLAYKWEIHQQTFLSLKPGSKRAAPVKEEFERARLRPEFVEPFKKVLSVEAVGDETISVILDGSDLSFAETFAIATGAKISGVLNKPVITFYLRDNVRWHDGVKFTARDVEFTYRSIINPAAKVAKRADFKTIEKFEILDDFRVRITYREPFSRPLDIWRKEIIPEHCLKGQDLNTAHFNQRNPIGTGPFRFDEWIAGERIVLTANDDFWGGKPGLAKIVFAVIQDEATIYTELLEGHLDIVELKPSQYVKSLKNADFNATFYTFEIPRRQYSYIGWNLARPLFADKKVRQALTLAIDRKKILEQTLFSLGEIAYGPFYPWSWAYNEAAEKFEYNPALAKQKLEEAGFADRNGDGIIEKIIDGREMPFIFTLLTNSENDQHNLAARLVKEDLAKVGIKVELESKAWGRFLSENVDRKNFDAIISSWSLAPDPDYFIFWHSSQIPDPDEGKNGFNSISYSNPEVDMLLEKARVIYDVKERKKMYYRVHEIIAEEQPYTFLCVPHALYAVNRRVVNVRPTTGYITRSVLDWRVEELPTGK